MRWIRPSVTAALLALPLCAATATAHDKWETMFGGSTNDDGPGVNGANTNVLVHGVIQTHDIEGSLAVPDQDWMLAPTTARHSYEARLTSVSGLASYGGCSDCIQFSRVNSGGTILTDQTNPLGFNGAVVVRWIASGTIASEYIRIRGNNLTNAPTANDQYTIEFFDTTLFGSRFNNTSTQVTVLFVQNTSLAAVTGNVYFYNSAGTLLHTEALIVASQGLQVISTPSIGALAGQSGSVAVAHTGGFGAITGKAVALEPATGFSFDTPLVSLPK